MNGLGRAFAPAATVLLLLSVMPSARAQEQDALRLHLETTSLSDYQVLRDRWSSLAENPGRLASWMRTEEGRLALRRLAAQEGRDDWRVGPEEARAAIARRIAFIDSRIAALNAQRLQNPLAQK